MATTLRWRSRSREPFIVIELDKSAAVWVHDAIEKHDPKDGATVELGQAIYSKPKEGEE